jgi:hypothetical protein
VDAGIAVAVAKFQLSQASAQVAEAGSSLSCGVGGVGAGEDPVTAVNGVNAMDWDAAVNLSAPNYDYAPTAPCPTVYGADSYGCQPAGGYNYWPGAAAGGGVVGAPGANSMMWLFNKAGCVGNYPNTPGDTLNPQQYFFSLCQASWWVYLPGWLSRISDPNWPGDGYDLQPYVSMTYAYRGHYELDQYRTGFRANCELWAFDSSGAFGWDDYPDGIADGLPPSYIGVMPRNVTFVRSITICPGEYVEVPVPTGTSGSGSTEDGFLGLATFDVWGIDFATWQSYTGLY